MEREREGGGGGSEGGWRKVIFIALWPAFRRPTFFQSRRQSQKISFNEKFFAVP